MRMMHCLSVKQPWANLIAQGRKTLEVRSWYPSVPTGSKILIVSSLRPPIAPAGMAVAVVTLYKTSRLREYHLPAACLETMPGKPSWAWLFVSPLRLYEPFPVKGRLGLWKLMVDEAQLRGAYADAWERVPRMMEEEQKK